MCSENPEKHAWRLSFESFAGGRLLAGTEGLLLARMTLIIVAASGQVSSHDLTADGSRKVLRLNETSF